MSALLNIAFSDEYKEQGRFAIINDVLGSMEPSFSATIHEVVCILQGQDPPEFQNSIREKKLNKKPEYF